jgi:hypothetical protein
MDPSMRILLFFFTCWIAEASDLCLMLSAEEETMLADAEGQARKGKVQGKDSHALRLDGIIYSHPKSWTIWINGRPIKSGDSIDTLRILNVTPESVEGIWTPNTGQSHPFSLKPHEVFEGSKAFP